MATARGPTGLSTRLTPHNTSYGGHNPAEPHKTIFGSNGPPHPRGGKVALAVEEGMVRNIAILIAIRVTSDGIGAFDVELGDFQAAGQIIDQVYKRIAYESIIGTARAAISAMTNHRGFRTRPSTM